MHTGSTSDRKAVAWRKAIAALLAQPATEDYRRLRALLRRRSQSWQFLAWTYIIAKTFGTEWFSGEKAYASEGGDNSPYIAHEEVEAPANTTEVAAAAINDDTALQVSAETETIQFEDVTVAPAPQGSSSLNFSDGQLSNGLSLGTSVESISLSPDGGGGSVTIQITAPQFVIINPIEIIQPNLDFFDGFADFTHALGFEDFTAAFADALPESVLTQVLGALEFAENPVAPLLAWQSSGTLGAPGFFTNFDSFDTDWTVQANGVLDGQQVQLQSSSEDSLSWVSQNIDTAGNEFGNSATLIDGQDWDGQLNVFGNYYEFNTIIQVNVLWDNDSVSAFSGFGNSIGATHINTANNTQENFAQIVDINSPVSFFQDELEIESMSTSDEGEIGGETVDVPGAPISLGNAHDTGGTPIRFNAKGASETSPQVIAGGVSEHFQSIQLNDIIDLDEITLNVDDVGTIASGSADTVQFADFTPGGHTQTNDSLFVTDPLLRLDALPGSGFRGNFDGPNVENVFGNFYEFNTIIQLNLIDDIDEFNMLSGQSSADASNGNGVIASGGNLVFNEATILQNDHFDNLFVAGRYSEFNLVLQLNFIDDADSILQIASPFMQQLPNDGDPSSIVVGTPGGSGSNGGSSAFEMPGFALDEIAMRSSNVDVLM